jgi:hypothetical protein
LAHTAIAVEDRDSGSAPVKASAIFQGTDEDTPSTAAIIVGDFRVFNKKSRIEGIEEMGCYRTLFNEDNKIKIAQSPSK